MANNYLVFSSLAAAQSRSAAQATANGCDGVLTEFWWSFGGGSSHINGIVPPTALSGAVVIGPLAPYDETYLTAAEKSTVQTEAALTALGWKFPSGGAATSASAVL